MESAAVDRNRFLYNVEHNGCLYSRVSVSERREDIGEPSSGCRDDCRNPPPSVELKMLFADLLITNRLINQHHTKQEEPVLPWFDDAPRVHLSENSPWKENIKEDNVT